MYRVRNVIKVTLEGWNASIENVARINKIAKERGWSQATVWTQSFGPFAELCIEVEYPDLATYERESAALFADAKVMQLIGDGMQYRRGDDPGYNELWQRAEPVAGG